MEIPEVSLYPHFVIDPDAPEFFWVSPSGSNTLCRISRLKEMLASLEWSVCRLYDTELITASRACELLNCKIQDFNEIYVKFMGELNRG